MRNRFAALNTGIDRSRRPRVAGSRAWWCGLALLALHAGAAQADTPVSGSITQNTEWTTANSPYVLSGDVTIANGVRLTVDAGVQVRMSQGASLIVAGSLVAQGTAANRIVVTSADDVQGSSVAPGSWNAIKFTNAGDTSSSLSYVSVRYGTGISVDSSPALNYVDITDEAGPAITVTPAASPTGQNLSAARNQLNGILVFPLDPITGNTSWHLKGIPYVVQGGNLEVGLPPFGLSPSQLSLFAGQTGHLTVNIPVLAPASGFMVAFQSSSGAATVTTQVTIPAGEHSADVAITAVAVGSATITASAPGYADATVLVTVAPAPPLSFVPAHIEVARGYNTSAAVQIPNAIGSDVVVHLNTPQPGTISVVPSDVTIPSGQTSASFNVQGIEPGSATISAQADGFASPPDATVHVHEMAISASNVFVPPNDWVDVLITLTDPAPEGFDVSVNNHNSSVVTAPGTVHFAGGDTTATMRLTGVANGSTTLDLSGPGYQPTTITVTVDTISAHFTTTSTINLAQGATSTQNVVLTRPAPANGVTIALTSSAPSIVSVQPAQVTIAAGSTTSSTSVTLTGVGGGTAVIAMESQEFSGIDGVATVTVTALPKLVFSINTFALGKGFQSVDANGNGEIYVETDSFTNVPAAVPITLALTGADASSVSLSRTQVTIPANFWRSEAIAISGLGLTQSDVQLTASATGYAAPQPVDVRVVEPAFSVSLYGNDGNTRMVGESREQATWSLGLLDPTLSAQYGGQQYLAAANTLSLAAPEGIIDGFYTLPTGQTPNNQIGVPAGSSMGTFYVGTPLQVGTYQVHATFDGLGEWISEPQHVVAPQLHFEDSAFTIGKGLYATLTVDVTDGADGCFPDLQSLTVTSADTSKVTISDISPYSYCARSFTVHGVDLTDAQTPVLITASATNAASVTLPVTVIAPALAFQDLDGVRSLAYQGQDDFEVVFAGDHSPASETTVSATVTATNETPQGVLPNNPIWDWGNGVITTPVSVPAQLRVAGAQTLGTYQITASAPGVATATSDVQTVVASQAHFEVETEGRGLGNNQPPVTYPVGNGLKLLVRLSLDQPAGDDPVTIRLVNHAESYVTVPASITLCADLDACNPEFEIVAGDNVSPPEQPIAIDAIVGSDTVPSATLLVQVVQKDFTFFDPDLGDSLTLGRAVDGVPSAVQAAWTITYFCAGDPNPNCTVEQAVAQPVQLTLSTVADAGGTPVVTQFFDNSDGTSPTTTLSFDTDASASNVVYAGTPTGPGTYRIRATLGAQTFTSDPIVVGVPYLSFDGLPSTLTLGKNLARSIYALQRVSGGGKEWQAFRVNSTSVHLSCANATVCAEEQDVVIPGGSWISDTPAHVRGLSVGSTTLQGAANGVTPTTAIPVDVQPAKLQFSPIGSMQRGTQTTVNLSFAYPFDNQWPFAAGGMTLSVSSLLPDVAAVTPQTVTIPFEQSGSGEITVQALRAGKAVLNATGPDVQTATSNTITVN